VACRGSVEAPPGIESVILWRVHHPDGSLAAEYSENLQTKAAAAAVQFRLALNDATGRWRLVAKEAISGQQAVHPIVVR